MGTFFRSRTAYYYREHDDCSYAFHGLRRPTEKIPAENNVGTDTGVPLSLDLDTDVHSDVTNKGRVSTYFQLGGCRDRC